MQKDLSFCASQSSDERMAWQEGGKAWQQRIGDAPAHSKKVVMDEQHSSLRTQASKIPSLPTYEEASRTSLYVEAPTTPVRRKKRRAPEPPTYPSSQEFVDQ